MTVVVKRAFRTGGKRLERGMRIVNPEFLNTSALIEGGYLEAVSDTSTPSSAPAPRRSTRARRR